MQHGHRLLATPVLALALLAGCAGPTKMYGGADQPPERLAHVHFTNAPGFFSQFYINVIGLDDKDFRKEPYSYAQAYVQPGKHRLRVTFTDFDNYIIPVNFRQKQFQGYYEIEFEARAGMQYAPIFNLSLGEKNMLAEMCVAEVSQRDSVSKTREAQTYVGCGKPTMEPSEENIKVCAEWSWIGNPPKTYEDACKAIVRKQG